MVFHGPPKGQTLAEMSRIGLFRFPQNVDCKEGREEYTYEKQYIKYCSFLDTSVTFPCRFRIYYRTHKREISCMADQGNNRVVEQDTFFYYLFVVNIVLLNRGRACVWSG